MKLKIAVGLLLILALIAGGCASSVSQEDYDALLAEYSELQTDYDTLVITVLIDKQIAALNDLDLTTVYNQRTPGYKSRVTFEEFQTYIEMAYSDVIPLVGTMEINVIDLVISVEGEWAYMTGKLALNGNVLQEYTSEFPDIWHKIDGTWYDVEENPMDPGYDSSELP